MSLSARVSPPYVMRIHAQNGGVGRTGEFNEQSDETTASPYDRNLMARGGGNVEGAMARLLESGVTALSSLMVTDAYGKLVRPRLAALLGQRGTPQQLPEIERVDQLGRELAEARERGDAETQQALETELTGYVRQLVAADPGLVEEFVTHAQADPNRERTEPGGRVSFSNNTFHGPVQGHGVQHNTL